MTQRPGLSLTEVLVALFLMAIGVIGVLTMFPVGAVQMGLALKDQRCAEAATQADGYIRWYWRHNVVEAKGGSEAMWSELNRNPNPSDPYWSKPAPNDYLTLPEWLNGPSVPVIVDPMGTVAGRSATLTGTSIARVNLNAISNATPSSVVQPYALRACTLLDGFTYDAGVPKITGSSVDRENRYNWMWVIQRPRNRDKYTVNMSVIVFDKRAHMYIPPGAEQSASATFQTGLTSVSPISPVLPELQKGGWIMDASTASTPAPNSYSVPLADFYRVASVATGGGSLELQSPIRTPIGGTTRSSNMAVYFNGVAEVFDRPQLTSDDSNAP